MTDHARSESQRPTRLTLGTPPPIPRSPSASPPSSRITISSPTTTASSATPPPPPPPPPAKVLVQTTAAPSPAHVPVGQDPVASQPPAQFLVAMPAPTMANVKNVEFVQEQAKGYRSEQPPTLPPRGTTRHSREKRRYKHSKKILIEEDPSEWSTASKCGFSLLMFIVEVLLFGALALVFFWVFYFRGGVAWHDDIRREFNLHPLLMVSGFVFLLGQAILVYRGLRCCRKIYNKLVHTVIHLLVMPAAAIAAVAVFDFHGLSNPPIPDLYSLHSWMGLATLGLFAVQFLVGFLTFLVLLCCENSSARFRAAMLPLHVHFGLVTFLLGIATCLTGLTEKAIFELGGKYSAGSNEGRVMNALGIVLIALAILLTYIVRNERYRRVVSVVLDERL